MVRVDHWYRANADIRFIRPIATVAFVITDTSCVEPFSGQFTENYPLRQFRTSWSF